MQSDNICKPLEEMTLMDHFMFEEVRENPENTKLMLDIILIAPFDLFGYGLYRYTFVGQCAEIPELKMNDGATRIFLNTKGTDNTGVSNELIEFLKFMEFTNDETIEYTSPKILKLKENIKTMLKDTEYSIKYLRFREAYYREHKEEIETDKAAARAEGLAEGLAEGCAEGRAEGHTMGVTEATHNNIIEL